MYRVFLGLHAGKPPGFVRYHKKHLMRIGLDAWGKVHIRGF
jgi:hypothetical protein